MNDEVLEVTPKAVRLHKAEPDSGAREREQGRNK